MSGDAHRTKSPYSNRTKKPVTIRLDAGIVTYFKDLSDQLGVPYQTLVNLFLRDCVESGKRPSMEWR